LSRSFVSAVPDGVAFPDLLRQFKLHADDLAGEALGSLACSAFLFGVGVNHGESIGILLPPIPQPWRGTEMCKVVRERQTNDRKALKIPKIDVRRGGNSRVFNRKYILTVKIAFLACKKMEFGDNSLHRENLFR
jgi:hypothetical protein